MTGARRMNIRVLWTIITPARYELIIVTIKRLIFNSADAEVSWRDHTQPRLWMTASPCEFLTHIAPFCNNWIFKNKHAPSCRACTLFTNYEHTHNIIAGCRADCRAWLMKSVAAGWEIVCCLNMMYFYEAIRIYVLLQSYKYHWSNDITLFASIRNTLVSWIKPLQRWIEDTTLFQYGRPNVICFMFLIIWICFILCVAQWSRYDDFISHDHSSKVYSCFQTR